MQAYPSYRDSGIEWLGEIPRHWGISKLKYLVSKIGSGVTPRGGAETYQESGIPFIRSQNVHFDGLRLDDIAYISKEVHESMSNSAISPNDVLINITGASIGRCAVVPSDFGEANVNQHVCILRANGKINHQFLNLVLSSNVGQIQVWLGQGGAAREGLNYSNLGNFFVLLPLLDEQEKIVERVNSQLFQIDTLIEKKQRQIYLLQEQRTALINHAVTKGLDPNAPMKDSGVEWLGEIPGHWTMTTVRYVYDVKLGKMLDSNKQNGNGLVKPYLRAANIHWNKVLLDEVGLNKMEFSEPQLERYLLQSGDLLVTEGGVTVGRSAVWNGELTECYYQNSLNRARPVKDISTKWLFYWMYFVTKNGFIDILADKSTFGHLTNEKLKALPVPVPPVSEHDEIIEKLESYEPKMDSQIALIERQIAYLQEYRTALISEAVTGKIDVREWRRTVHE